MIIYLWGSDSLRRNRKLADLAGQYRQKYGQVDLSVFDLEENPDDWRKIADFLGQPSMFVDSKVAIIRGSGAIDRKEWRQILRSQIKTEKTFLLISDRQGPKADFRFLREKAFLAKEFSELAGAELAAWVKKEAAVRQLAFAAEAWNYFLGYLDSLAESRSWAAIQELEKVFLAGLPKPVQGEDLRRILNWSAAEGFQSLVNPLFLSSDWRRRLFLAEKLFLQREDSGHIFNALAYRSKGSRLVKFADYDIAIKSGSADYESAIFDFALAGSD